MCQSEKKSNNILSVAHAVIFCEFLSVLNKFLPCNFILLKLLMFWLKVLVNIKYMPSAYPYFEFQDLYIFFLAKIKVIQNKREGFWTILRKK